MIVKLIVDGGGMKPGPAVAQQLGPMGINLGKVIEEVNVATKEFNGMKVPVEMDVNPKSKTFSIKVSSPATAELIKKEINVESGSGQAAKVKVGNLAIEQVIGIAKKKMSGMLAKDLKKAVRMVVGSCVSSGVLIEGKNAKEIELDIEQGVYDKEIKSESTELSKDKKDRLSREFAVVKAKQEADAKVLEAAKLAEEAAKAQATAATPAAPAATPAAAPAKDAKAKKK